MKKNLQNKTFCQQRRRDQFMKPSGSCSLAVLWRLCFSVVAAKAGEKQAKLYEIQFQMRALQGTTRQPQQQGECRESAGPACTQLWDQDSGSCRPVLWMQVLRLRQHCRLGDFSTFRQAIFEEIGGVGTSHRISSYAASEECMGIHLFVDNDT